VDESCSIPTRNKRFFSIPNHAKWHCGPSKLRGFFLGVKLSVIGISELCHSNLYNAEFRNKWRCFSAPLISLHSLHISLPLSNVVSNNTGIVHINVTPRLFHITIIPTENK